MRVERDFTDSMNALCEIEFPNYIETFVDDVGKEDLLILNRWPLSERR